MLTLEQAGVQLIDCVHNTPPFVDEGFPYVAIPQMRNGELILSEARNISAQHFEEWTRKANPQPFDMVLSRHCNPGQTAYVRPNMRFAVGQNLVLLRANNTRVRPAFLRWVVRSQHWWNEIDKFLNVGAVFDSLRCADVPKFRVPVPPLDQQDSIASALGALDDKIDLNRRINETLEAMARAIFKDWFVDFGPTRAKAEGRKPPSLSAEIAALFPDALDDEDKPVGWHVTKVGDLVDLLYGKALKAEYRNPGPVKVYGSNGQVGLHSERLVAGPGVVIGRKGNPGTVNYVNGDFFPIDTTFYVAGKGDLKSIPFFWLQLSALNLSRLAADSAVPGLNRDMACSVECVRPNPYAVEAFDGIVRPLLNRCAYNEEENDTLTQLRDLLLPKLMSGEIRLKQAEHAVEAVL